MKKTREEKNGIIAALFLFQYSLLIPLMKFIKPSLLIAVSGIILLSATLIVNKRFAVNLRSMTVVALLLVIMLLKTVIDESEIGVVVNFLVISIPPLIVFSYQFDRDSFMRTSYRLSFVNFILLFLLPFIGKSVSYMRFGYGMVLTVMFSYLAVFRASFIQRAGHIVKNPVTGRIINIIVLVVSALETIVYGSRGVFVVMIAFIAIDVLLIYRNHKLRNFFLIAAAFAAIVNIEQVLDLLIDLAGRFGVRSYALRKYQYQLTVGLEEASSGRNRLYQNAFNTIVKHPILGDKMITYDDGTLYVHNLFLQVGRDMGVIMMIVSVVFVLYCLYLLINRRIDTDMKTVIAVFFCVSAVRLLISSNVWERPEFWALVCIALNYKTIITEKKENVDSV